MDWLKWLFILGAIASIIGLFIAKRSNKQSIKGDDNQQAGGDIKNENK